MRTIEVRLGERSYPIIIKRGVLDEVGGGLKRLGFSGRVTVVTNPLVERLYGRRLHDSLKSGGLEPLTIVIPDGEEFKSLDSASRIYDFLIENRMERNSPVVALGGGVIGDLAGFVAATYLRGVPFVQVPTTLLAQVDSSVGGKTAVNHPMGKNLIGAFYQPKMVFIDPDTLKTLDVRDVRAGLAEVIKYGIIWDRTFFEFLERNAKGLASLDEEIIRAIERSCEIKAEVVSRDEREEGLRAILNFGHTFGHAIENLTGYGPIKHGEAVAMGMVLAARLSLRLGLCVEDTVLRIRGLVKALGLQEVPGELHGPSLIGPMKVDKKVIGGGLRFVLVKALGEVTLKEVREEELKGFLSQ